LNDDVFAVIGELQSESAIEFEKPEQLFACWLYASWLLKVDVDARFPEFIAKPSVSNPLNQYDPNLALAEQLKICVAELRPKAEDAARLLKTILQSNRNVFMTVLTKECFLEALSKVPAINYFFS
uniref:Nuclear pore complex protein Nup85 n=1 Tax=Gongylonema pulchrum TaxID=637853 RepID=A0A183EPC1_9BILA